VATSVPTPLQDRRGPIRLAEIEAHINATSGLAATAAVGSGSPRHRAPLLAALPVVTLALASRADAYIYRANSGDDAIGPANLDGTRANHDFIITELT
jgi:hypothetical protein